MESDQSTFEATRTERLPAGERPGREEGPRPPVNVAQGERWASLAAGAVLALLGLGRRGVPGAILGGVGGGLLYRGVTGRCPMYSALGIDTAQGQAPSLLGRAVRITQTYMIGKPAHELYAYWRHLENLPRIMRHLESVRVIDDKRSHWVAKAPSLVGGRVEWDAEITADEPNTRIAWQGLPEADIQNSGSIRFVDRGDRGTSVTVELQYTALAGRLGKWAARLFGEEPEQQIQEDLRRFKRVMETGEAPTIQGQPHGTCKGTGERYYD